MRSIRQAFLTLACASALLTPLFAVLPVAAQVSGATITGVLTDGSGAVVPGVQVTVRNLDTGITNTVPSNSSGTYFIPNMTPGKYHIVFAAPGFSRVERDLMLSVGSVETLSVSMPLGQASSVVEVKTNVELNAENATVSGEIDGTAVRELPLNGRDWSQLAELQPGISQVRNQSTIGGVGSADVVRGARGFGNQLSIAGTRPTQNNYRLDGISFNDYTNGAPGSVLSNLSGVDAIAEFSVLTADYGAEYGRTSGGVINAVTKSGTNKFHGDAYEFIRNSALDARNYFDGDTVPPFRRNQFGASAGGPIFRDKTFFFFNYEGLRQSLSSTVIDTTPSANARAGILSSGNVTVDPKVTPFLQFWPLPNLGLLGGGDTGLYRVVTKQTGTDNFYTGRITHHFSSSDQLGATFLYDKSFLTNPDPLNNEGFSNSNSRPFFALEETHTFTPNLVNAVRLGFSRNYAVIATSPAINPLAADTTLSAVPGQPAPFLSVPGISTFFGGLDGFPNFTFGWNSIQLYDDAFLSRGKHTLKFGFAMENMHANNLFHFFDDGRFSFASLSDFLTNVPQSFSGNVPTADSPRNLRSTLFGGYVQDDWKMRPNLTVNLGLRYEMTTIVSEAHGKLASLPTMDASTIHTGAPYFSNPTLKNFEPRLGFAWSPLANQKTLLRGGFALYDVLPLPYEFLIISSASAPFLQSVTTANPPAGSFPDTAYSIGLSQQSAGPLVGQRVAYVQPHPSRSYVGEWNLSIQQALPGSFVGTISYIGSRGIHLPYRTDDADIVLPTSEVNGQYYWPTPVASGTQINPNVGRIDRLTTDGDSYYHGMLLRMTRSLNHGLQVQGSYTYQKSIDTGSSTIAGDQFSNSPSSLPFWFDPKIRRGQSDFNLGQSAVLSGTWLIPDITHGNSLLHTVADSWQLGAIFQASTGSPFPVLIGGDPLGLNNTDPYDYPDRTPGCGKGVNPRNVNNYINLNCFTVPTPINRLGNAGRNPLTGPGLEQMDMSVFKNFPLSNLYETANIQFRAEFFNVFNRANFAAPLDNDVLFTQDNSPAGASAVGGAGTIDATQTASRQIQFGLKLVW